VEPLRTRIDLLDTHRLVPSRFPSVGVFNAMSSPADLEAILELEGWTNDRVSAELGILQRIPQDEWVLGVPHATVVMASFCHPRPGGGRFNSEQRGAWYAGFELETAHAETTYHRTKELQEINVLEARVEMRLYLANFHEEFHDIRSGSPEFSKYHDPDDYVDSQNLVQSLLAARSNGILYRSVRRPGGHCIACFRPPLVKNIRPSAHFEYRWEGGPVPRIIQLREPSGI
jgi:RES domain